MINPRLRASAGPAIAAAISLIFTSMPNLKAEPATKPDSVKVASWGKSQDGTRVQLYTLTNSSGVQVSLATYGGTVIKLKTPDRNGKLGDIALGFNTIDPYFSQTAYFGAIIGRYGNRIGKGKFSLDGKTYQLAKNNAPNHLHGGVKGFDKRVWHAEVVSQNPPAIQFSRTSVDGEEGYPGNLKIAVTYTLTDKDELKIQYAATTDKDTVVNFTNHTYFNLAGAGNGSVLGHQIQIHASHYTPVDKTLIPTGEIKSVTGTPFDLQKPTVIGNNIKAVGGKPVGFDHNYVLDKGLIGKTSLAAEVYEPKSGRVLKVYTDQPGVQFYTGNFLDGTLIGKGGKTYHQHDAFCLETQHFPDSPNKAKFPTTVLHPGETFKSTTVYKFAVK